FTDHNLSTSTNYYRLKVVDADGKVSYSKIILIKEHGASLVLTVVRPNPFTRELTVSLTLTAPQKLTFTLVDAAGRTVAVKKTTGIQGLNTVVFDGLGNVAKGLYVLQVQGADAQLREKVIKKD
ncbi:MAG TPA: T9SS type A sorting domain-containing protein, partial [Flavisolibacter sp.]|nr:T9SS type A sorting domain-containing protein [Flavisolibacter sp.]